jgi:hypothetical protein
MSEESSIAIRHHPVRKVKRGKKKRFSVWVPWCAHKKSGLNDEEVREGIP